MVGGRRVLEEAEIEEGSFTAYKMTGSLLEAEMRLDGYDPSSHTRLSG